MYTYIKFTRIYIYICSCLYVCICVCVQENTHVYMYVRTYVCMYICRNLVVHERTRVCLHKRMHACNYECMHVCMYVHMYPCVYCCIYVCANTRRYERVRASEWAPKPPKETRFIANCAFYEFATAKKIILHTFVPHDAKFLRCGQSLKVGQPATRTRTFGYKAKR